MSITKTVLLISMLVFSLCAAERLPFAKAMQSEAGGRYLLDNATIDIQRIPSTIDEFLSYRDMNAKDPRGGYASFILAMIVYGKNKELGIMCMTSILDPSLLVKENSKASYKGYVPDANTMYLIRQIDKYTWLGSIYIDGTDVANSYALPGKGPYTISFNQLTLDSADVVRLYANVSSGNLARPITLQKTDKGFWKALNISSVVVGPSKMPKQTVKDID